MVWPRYEKIWHWKCKSSSQMASNGEKSREKTEKTMNGEEGFWNTKSNKSGKLQESIVSVAYIAKEEKKVDVYKI